MVGISETKQVGSVGSITVFRAGDEWRSGNLCPVSLACGGRDGVLGRLLLSWHSQGLAGHPCLCPVL